MSLTHFNNKVTDLLTPGRAHIIGVGRSGIAAAKVLKKKGWQVVLSDSNDNPSLQQQAQDISSEGIDVKLAHRLNLLETQLDLIVISPGVPWDSPILEEARDKKIAIIGEIELAYCCLSSVPWIGITGTNGKTTTTALTAAIFQTAGMSAPACGNIGYAACELALKNSEHLPDWIIAEISSFQIESSSTLSPQIGVWTTFTPDHLNRHKTMENYYKIKASLLKRSKYQVFNADDAYLSQVGTTDWTKNAYSISTQGRRLNNLENSVYLEDNWIRAFGELIMPVNLFKMPGNHNQQNLLLAVAVARLAGIEKSAIVEAMTKFTGVVHRLEKVSTIQGIDYINDSKATNYDAAQVGLSSVKGSVILIAGGQAKEGDDQAWLETIKQKVSTVLLIGQAASLFAKRLEDAGYTQYEQVQTMERAVQRSWELSQTQKVQVVLLSPACASFDQYKSFEERGEHFRYLSEQLAIGNDILKGG